MLISNRQVHEQCIVELPDMPDDYYFDESFRNIGIPRLSLGLLWAIDSNRVARQRRENYLQLEKVVKQFPDLVPLFANLQDGVCPLVFPIIVKDRSVWAGALARLGIGVYPWWEGYHRKCSWEAFAEARYLKDHLLCLPVNQALGERHMAFIGQAVTELRSEMC
jgi:dTDP-4-amino-4,6-dideoxygalactose transaminase